MTDNSDTFYEAKIPALNADGDEATVEVTVSIGEFDGLVLGIEGLTYESAELTVQGATALRDALTAAIGVLSRAQNTDQPGQ